MSRTATGHVQKAGSHNLALNTIKHFIMLGQRLYIGLKKRDKDVLQRGRLKCLSLSSMDPTHAKPVQPATAVFSDSKETPLSFSEHHLNLLHFPLTYRIYTYIYTHTLYIYKKYIIYIK